MSFPCKVFFDGISVNSRVRRSFLDALVSFQDKPVDIYALDGSFARTQPVVVGMLSVFGMRNPLQVIDRGIQWITIFVVDDGLRFVHSFDEQRCNHYVECVCLGSDMKTRVSRGSP